MDPIFWIPIGIILLIAIVMVGYSYWRGEKGKLDVERRAELDGREADATRDTRPARGDEQTP